MTKKVPPVAENEIDFGSAVNGNTVIERVGSDDGIHSRDSTESETQLRQAEKFKAIGQLTGGIAHDFNNLLTVISMNLQMLHDILPEGHEYLDFIDPALRAASSGEKLTSHLLAFAQHQPLRPKSIALDQFLSTLRELAVRIIGPHCSIDVRCPTDVWNCLADRVQLESALLNMIVNARDAMPAGGEVQIEARNVVVADSIAGLPSGGYVTLSVTDEGIGVAPEIMHRVFEPFFTTKPIGKGTGLGLSMVMGFARQSGGRVQITSEAQRGTQITLHLPRATKDTVDTDGRDTISANWRPLPFHTLVVDDAPDVLRAVTRMCRQVGLQAVGAQGAEEAIAILENSDRFDLLLTDVILPGRLGGPELSREAIRAIPTIRTLFTSGYTDADILNRAKLDPGAELLLKPYTRTQLLVALRRVMTGNTPPSAAADCSKFETRASEVEDNIGHNRRAMLA